MTRTIGIVFGTFNRLPLLRRAIQSIYVSTGEMISDVARVEIVVVDGGSTDGSREWLASQQHVHTICQEGPLTGAVAAFNLGFGYCVDQGYGYIGHLNDDAELVTPHALGRAVELMEHDPAIGEVAFEHNLRGDWRFEHVNGRPYANFGLIRRNAGIQVANAQGDPTGRLWWNPIYRTYGADTELGVWLWKLGWRVHEAHGLRVHDIQAQDELRVANNANNKHGDSDLFWSRWRHESFPNVREPRRPPRGRPPRARIPRAGGGRPGNTR